ncbi:hypothetical protein V6N13_124798 [Hibiscus sabdariffa]|uniref:Uncharacterized protein n=1 Tax=Hibiscus sabdariffa TaxID=183260 RepID=A0ABR2U4B6_9ROSI
MRLSLEADLDAAHGGDDPSHPLIEGWRAIGARIGGENSKMKREKKELLSKTAAMKLDIFRGNEAQIQLMAAMKELMEMGADGFPDELGGMVR